jgi:ATP-dependent DNA ligase
MALGRAAMRNAVDGAPIAVREPGQAPRGVPQAVARVGRVAQHAGSVALAYHGRLAAPEAPGPAAARERARRSFPPADGWLYEPKWDGFTRDRVRRTAEDVYLQSRGSRPLGRYFPELVAGLPRGRYVLDGEIVIVGADGAP